MSTETFTCRRITCREAFSRPEWPALEKAYGEEIVYEDLPPAPDRRMYELLEAQGILRPVGLFEGEELIARCICHECDHLDGHMYTEKVEGGLHDVNYEEPEEE